MAMESCTNARALWLMSTRIMNFPVLKIVDLFVKLKFLRKIISTFIIFWSSKVLVHWWCFFCWNWTLRSWVHFIFKIKSIISNPHSYLDQAVMHDLLFYFLIYLILKLYSLFSVQTSISLIQIWVSKHGRAWRLQSRIQEKIRWSWSTWRDTWWFGSWGNAWKPCPILLYLCGFVQ